MKLTKRQTEVLNFIQSFIEKNGFPPTRTEIAKALGFKSPNAAEDHIKALAKKGAVILSPGASRGIQIPNSTPSGLPLVGRVAAGSPIMATEHVEKHFAIDPSLFTPNADYLLRVRGNSMIDAGIFEDDLVAVHKTSEARNGQIVVARIDDDVTVKRYEKINNQIRLLPENANYEPILVDQSSGFFTIEGLAVGVLRQGLM